MATRRMEGKVALLTGAASGIGRSAAVLLAREGASVLVADLDSEGAGRVAAEINEGGGRAVPLALDVTSEADWVRAAGGVAEGGGRLDVLVNNAGVASAGTVAETTLADWRRVQAVNLDGAFLGIKCCGGLMRRGGSIVNVASASGRKASAGAAAYCVSKAGLLMLTRVAALELAAAGVRVNAVLPGGVRTPMWEGTPFWPGLVAEHGGEEGAWLSLAAGTPLGRFADPDEVARAILFLASDESAIMSGAELVLDGGFSAS